MVLIRRFCDRFSNSSSQTCDRGKRGHGFTERPALAFTRCRDLSGILMVAAEAIGIQTMFMQKEKKKKTQPCNLDTII